MTCVLAIDQGTSGTKAIVVDESGSAIALAEVALAPRYLAGGGVEQDPEELYDSVVTAGRRAVADAGRPIAAVALANQGETVLAWDRGDRPAAVAGDRLAGPPSRSRVRSPVGRRVPADLVASAAAGGGPVVLELEQDPG